jgi:hypothetical protein
METKPLMMPQGSTRKKGTGLVEPGSRTVLSNQSHRNLATD